MNSPEKQLALQAAFDAIQAANVFGLTEREKSFLCDHVFQTALRDTARTMAPFPKRVSTHWRSPNAAGLSCSLHVVLRAVNIKVQRVLMF
jgi:hypothetical protein